MQLAQAQPPAGPVYRYSAYAQRVHDGDTYQLRVDLGFDVAISIMCRLAGANSPELDTDAGKDARDYVAALLTPGEPEGERPPARPLIIESHKSSAGTAERSFARWVCDVWMANGHGEYVSLREALIAAGHAKPFDPAHDVWHR